MGQITGVVTVKQFKDKCIPNLDIRKENDGYFLK